MLSWSVLVTAATATFASRPTTPNFLRPHRLLQTTDKRGQRGVECSCQSRKRVQSRIAPAALDAADVGGIEIRALGELLLRQPATVPEPPYALPDAARRSSTGRNRGENTSS